MAQKSHKNNKHIAELIESATVTALQLLAQVDKFAMLGGIDASLPDDQARAALREHILKIKREDITIADQEAVRLLQLVRFRTEEILEHAYRELEFEQHAEIATFDKSADAMTPADLVARQGVARLRPDRDHLPDPPFPRAQEVPGVHGARRRRARLPVDAGSREEAARSVGEILELDDEAKQNCELIHFEMDEGDADAKRRMHYLVVYHPGKMRTLRQMKDRRRDLLLYIPALEATLVYDPAANKVHVLSDKRGTAQRLADRFVAVGFDKPLSKFNRAQKFDVAVAKNYLTEGEMAQLSRLVNAYLDVAEDMAQRKIPMTMQDWETRLNRFIEATDRDVLQDAGKVTAEIAKAHAESEFEKYRIVQDRLFASDFDRVLKQIEAQCKPDDDAE